MDSASSGDNAVLGNGEAENETGILVSSAVAVNNADLVMGENRRFRRPLRSD